MIESALTHVVRATPKTVVPQLILLGLLLFVAGVACSVCSTLPPRRFCVALAVGSAVFVMSKVLQRKCVSDIAAVMTGIVCLGSLYPFVLVRVATSDDRIYERYFGAPHEEECRVRNIAVVSGDFTLNNWVVGRLYYVANGAVTKLNQFGIGRSPNRLPAATWEHQKITIALVDYDTREGRITQLASAGQSRGGGSSNEIPTSIEAKYAEIVPGTLLRGQSRVLYVEGNSPIALRSGETVNSFATSHSGSYYVVEVGFK